MSGPTQEAYDAACRALWHHRDQASALLAVVKQAYDLIDRDQEVKAMKLLGRAYREHTALVRPPPLGRWGLDGAWQPNPHLGLTPAQQWEHNYRNGYVHPVGEEASNVTGESNRQGSGTDQGSGASAPGRGPAHGPGSGPAHGPVRGAGAPVPELPPEGAGAGNGTAPGHEGSGCPPRPPVQLCIHAPRQITLNGVRLGVVGYEIHQAVERPMRVVLEFEVDTLEVQYAGE